MLVIKPARSQIQIKFLILFVNLSVMGPSTAIRVLSRIVQRSSKFGLIKRLRHNSLGKFEPSSIPGIRDKFKQFEGGSVTLRKDEEQGIAYIRLDHIEKKNGLSGKMMVDLHDIVNELELWRTGKGIILYGSGGTFCSGGYLETVRNIFNPEDGYKMATLMHDSILRLKSLPFISVSLVTGRAIGGGAELILATDFRLMTPSSEISFVEARMGVGTGWGGGTLLQRLVGQRTALDLLLTCRKVGSDEALVLGLAEDLVEENDGDDDETLVKRTTDWLQQRIAGHHHFVVQTVKGIVDCDDFAEERRLFAHSWGGLAHKAAMEKNIKHK